MALALGSVSVWAGEPGVTFEFADGQKATFAFSTKPEITATDDGLAISSSTTEAVTYQVADVLQFYFEDGSDDSKVETVVSEQHTVFNFANGVVMVNGMKADEQILVAAVSGIFVVSSKADGEGNARIDVSTAPAGVYIVRTGSGVSFKLIKL